MTKAHFYDIIKSPAISEKTTMIQGNANQVVFKVAMNASKPKIKAAIEGLFGVKVKAVNTLVRKGKVRRFKGKSARLSDTKRAIVTLAEGEKLDVTTGL